MNSLIIRLSRYQIRSILLFSSLTYLLYDSIYYSHYEKPLIAWGGQYSFSIVIIAGLAVVFLMLFMRESQKNPVVNYGLLYCICGFASTCINMSASSTINLFVQLFNFSCWLFLLFISYKFTIDERIFEFLRKLGIILSVLFMAVCWKIYKDKTLLTFQLHGAFNVVYFSLFFLPYVLLIRKRLLRIVILFCMFTTVLVSYKRAALLIFIIALLYFFRNMYSNQTGFSKKMLSVALICAVLGGGLILLKGIQSSFDLNWFERLMNLRVDKGSSRLLIWKSIISAIMRQSPVYWIIGYGYRTTVAFGGAHNDFLEILYDFGIIGFIAYLKIIKQLIMYSIRMKKAEYPYYRHYNVSIIMFLLYSSVGQFIYLPQSFLIMAVFWGMMISNFEKFERMACVS